MDFPCDQCGICCRAAGSIEELKHFDRGDGACINLDDDNSCKIYDDRPEICNTRAVYHKEYSKYWTWEEYCAFGEKVCNQLKEQFGEPS